MFKVFLNDKEFILSTYNRQTQIIDGQIFPSAQLFIINSDNAYENLISLVPIGINSIKIIDDDNETIYLNSNYNASIQQIDENFMGGQIMLNVFLNFTNKQE